MPIDKIFWLLSFFSVFQFYLIGVAGVYVSLYTAVSLIFLLAILIDGGYARIKVWSVYIVFLLLVYQAVSIVWAVDPMMGIRELGYSLFFPFVLLCLISVYLTKKDSYVKYLFWLTSFGLVNSFLVIIFMISPDLESIFLNSPLAKIFINPNTMLDFGELLIHNVRDPLKSGGFFINANPGAVFSEILFYASIICYRLSGRRLLLLFAFVHYVAIFMSGSKSAIVLAVVVPIFGLALMRNVINKINVLGIVFSVFVLLLGLVVFDSISGDSFPSSRFAQDADVNLFRRQTIWNFAVEQFSENPIKGLGFGGWAYYFQGYGQYWVDIGISDIMAAHNIFIILWSDSGLLAPILFLMFFSALLFHLTAFARAGGDFWVCWALFCVFISIFIHGMGENFSPISEVHMQLPYAILCGIVFGEHFKRARLC